MTAGKSDVVRKRLISAGLSAEACTKYIETLRAFLSARLTKSRYEDEMSKVLPKDKIHVHNGILQEILFRAQQKRDGMRDLPVVTPLKDKRPPRRETKAPSVKGNVTQSKAEAKVKTGTKRAHEEVESESRTNGITESGPPNVKKVKRPAGPKKAPEGPKPPPVKSKPAGIEKPSPKPAKRKAPGEPTPSLPPPSPGPATVPRMPPPKPAPPQATEVAAYNGLPYFPVRPGQALDFEFFLKLRQRMKRIAVERLGMSGLKDDAVALMLHGVELHVKSLMEAGARQRAARDGVRPHRNLQCGPVRGYDFREPALRNTALLGDESGMDLERLLMLL